MVIKSKENSLGAWAFLVGVILALVVGISSVLIPVSFIVKHNMAVYAILVLLGLMVGFLNVTGRESQTFMIAGAVLVIVSKFGMDSVTGSLIGLSIGTAVSSVFTALLVMFVPATIVVALISVFSIAQI
jgi:hypothetical protein